MVSKDGYVKILDFGLAKLFVAPQDGTSGIATAIHQETQPGTVMGTVGYMSPEQASGKPMDFRSDQFALGSILYEMATGKRAFHRGTGAQTLAAIIQDEPEPVAQVNPRVPAPLRWIVERCLAKDPDERYASTRDLARDLKSVREHIGEVTSTASGVAGIVEAAPRRSRARVLAIAALAALVPVLLAGIVIGRRGVSSSRRRFISSRSAADRFNPPASPRTARRSSTRRPGTGSPSRSSSTGPRARSRGPSEWSERTFWPSRAPARWRCRYRSVRSTPSSSTARSHAWAWREEERPARSWPTSSGPTGRRTARASPSCATSVRAIAWSTPSGRSSTRAAASSPIRASPERETGSPSSITRHGATTRESSPSPIPAGARRR